MTFVGRNLASTGLVLALIGCGDGMQAPIAEPKSRIQLLLESASQIESFRVDPKISISNPNVLWHYPILEQGADLTSEQVQQLSDAVGDWQRPNCGPEGIKLCIFSPGLGFRARRDSITLTVLICFDCEQWTFVPDSGNPLSVDADCDCVDAELRDLAYQIFPGHFGP